MFGSKINRFQKEEINPDSTYISGDELVKVSVPDVVHINISMQSSNTYFWLLQRWFRLLTMVLNDIKQ